MKLMALLLATLISFSVYSNESIIRNGELLSDGSPCQLEISPSGSSFSMVKLYTEENEYTFSTSKIDNGFFKRISGVFSKDGRSYFSINGAPLFALGRYYDVTLENKNDRIEITKETYVAYLVNWTRVRTVKDTCVLK